MTGLASCYCDYEEIDDDEAERLRVPSSSGFTGFFQDALSAEEGPRKGPHRTSARYNPRLRGRHTTFGPRPLHGWNKDSSVLRQKKDVSTISRPPCSAPRNTPFHSGPNSDGVVTFAMSELCGVTCTPSCDCSHEEDLSSHRMVTKTFHWKPEEFNLEVATYLQYEEQDWAYRSGIRTQGVRASPLKVAAIRCTDMPLEDLADGDLEAPHHLSRSTSRSTSTSLGDVHFAGQYDLLGDLIGKSSGMSGMKLLTDNSHDLEDDYNSIPLHLLDLREAGPRTPWANPVSPSQLDGKPAEASSNKGLTRGESWVADWSMLAPPPLAESSAPVWSKEEQPHRLEIPAPKDLDVISDTVFSQSHTAIGLKS